MNIATACRCPSGPRVQSESGFTLIELMITVAIIGILAAVAFPSYKSHIQRGNRASARAALMEAQQFMERFYAANDSYATDKAGGAVALPARFAAVPAESPKYSIALGTAGSVTAAAVTSSSYALEATPIQTDEQCATLWLKHTGEKGTSGTGTVADCWK